MARSNNAENAVGGENQEQPLGEPKGHAPAASSAPNYDPIRARHEAAHAVVIDDMDYEVVSVNIKPGAPRSTNANWGDFKEILATTIWDNPDHRDAIRPHVLRYVTSLAAGHLADNIANSAVERVSTRIQNNIWLLDQPPNMKDAKADRDRTALFLFLVQRNTMAEVVAAEDRALEIIKRRSAHLESLTALLVKEGTAEGAKLNEALGKGHADDSVGPPGLG